MGNTIETKLKEENPVLEVTETLVGQFKVKITQVLHAFGPKSACPLFINSFINWLLLTQRWVRSVSDFRSFDLTVDLNLLPLKNAGMIGRL